MRVLITGITGMAGSHLADYLLTLPENVQIVGTRRYRSRTDNIQHLMGKVDLIDCDLTDARNVDAMMEQARPDFIFHLAAISYVPASWASPTATITDNTSMQINLFESMLRHKIDCPIQLALSSEEYGMVYENELPINEDSPLRPLSPYGVSKVTQDLLGYQYFQSYGIKAIRTRTFNHEGPRRGEVFVTSTFAKQIAAIEAGLQEPVIYVGNLDARRDWSDVRDVVRAYWLAANKATPGDVYVIASGVTRSVGLLLDVLLGMSTVKVDVRQDPSRMRPSDVMVLQGDSSKFRKQTGWQPQIPFEKTMKDLLDYWREKVRK